MTQFISSALFASLATTLILFGTPIGEKIMSEQESAPEVDPDMLLPDLRSEPIRELYISTDEETGEKELRFSTTVSNVGEGPLDLSGAYDETTNTTVALQRIPHRADAVSERIAGYFIFHAEHDHWHFEDFTVLELYTYYEESGELHELLGSTDKLTFCIFDFAPVSPRVEHESPTSEYPGCKTTEKQGISPGWEDTYDASLPGQELNIEDVPDGRYALRAVADPFDRVLESDEANNVTVMYVGIRGDVVTVLDSI